MHMLWYMSGGQGTAVRVGSPLPLGSGMEITLPGMATNPLLSHLASITSFIYFN